MKRYFNIEVERFISENKDLVIKVAAVALVIVAAFFVFLTKADNIEDEIQIENEVAATEESVSSLDIFVDIGGAVKNPQVVKLPEGSRVEDAIKAAGGLTDKADLTEINRAAFLEDGEKVYIPEAYEEGETSSSVSKGDSRVNINTADSDELQKLNGIGPATAEKIIDYRDEHGRFSNIEDIKNVSGIGDKTFEKFEDDIKV
jgi:competence protein ComEA